MIKLSKTVIEKEYYSKRLRPLFLRVFRIKYFCLVINAELFVEV